MSDPRTLVDSIHEFKTCSGSRELLETLIYFLDLSEKDPEQWPALETILAQALTEALRETWEKAGKDLSHGLPEIWKKALLARCAFKADECCQQAKVKP